MFILKQKQLNLMQTPYEILQLKQKQKKKIISELKKQRSFSVRFNKNGKNATQYTMEKAKPSTQHRYRRNMDSPDREKRSCNSDKKYEIVFRESIRKVSTYRTKIYHTHSALKNEKFINKFFTTSKQNQSPKHKNILQNSSKTHVKKQPIDKVKTTNPEQRCQTLSVGKYRIFFTPNSQRVNHNQIPGFLVQKCKLNHAENENKSKIQKTIHNLYEHKQKMQKSIRKHSLQSFTDRDSFSEQTQRKYTQLNIFGKNSPLKQTLKSPRSTTEIKNQIRIFKQGGSTIIFDDPVLQTMDYTKVTNFIKSKKKKRLPISLANNSKGQQNDGFQFKRTITDNYSNQSHGKNIAKNMQERYYSPNKHSRGGARIKFNSIEDNISGWQFQTLDNLRFQQGPIKSPYLEY